MENDALKSAWKGIAAPAKQQEELRSMIQENRHPVLKRIRRQLTIEIIAFVVFLFVYYDFFDGHRRPLYVNGLLIASVLLVILHNATGYFLTRNRLEGHNLRQSLENHLSKMKMYAFVSIASRVVAITGLLVFFTYVITFTAHKYWLLAAMLLAFVIQVIILGVVWLQRIGKIKRSLNNLA